MKDTNGTELFNLEKNVAFPIFGCCYSNYFLPGYGLCCKYFCLPCFRFVTLQFTINFCYRFIFRCQAGDAEMKLISGNKKYNIKHIMFGISKCIWSPDNRYHIAWTIKYNKRQFYSCFTKLLHAPVQMQWCYLWRQRWDRLSAALRLPRTHIFHPSMEWMVQTYFIAYVDKSTVLG